MSKTLTQNEITLAQGLINALSTGDVKSVKEIYGNIWTQANAGKPVPFSKKFKDAVLNGTLTGITLLNNGTTVRSNGRCLEYEKI